MDLYLQGRSIVFLVQGNSPSMFTEKFLSHHNIVPEDLEVEDSNVIPPLSQIRFEDGYTFQAIDKKIKFEIKYPDRIDLESGGIEIEEQDILSDSMMRLLDAAPYLDYVSLGINFVFALDSVNLGELTNESIEEFNVNRLHLSKPIDETKLNLNFQQASKDKAQVEANYHHDLNIPEESLVEGMKEYLSRQQERFSHSQEVIENIF